MIGEDDGAGTGTDHHFVYVVECADGTLYTGYAKRVFRRVVEHNAGKGARYTRGRTPVRLRHLERYPSRSRAMRREAEIKALPRRRKLELVEQARPAPRAEDEGLARTD